MLHGHMEEPNRCSPWAADKPRCQVQSPILTSEGLSQYPTSDQRHKRLKVSARRFDRQAATANTLTVWSTWHLKARAENIYARSLSLNRMCQSWAGGNMGAIMFPPSPGSTSVRTQRPQWPGKALGPVRASLTGLSLTHRTDSRPSGSIYSHRWLFTPTSGRTFIWNEARQVVNSRCIENAVLRVNIMDTDSSLEHDLKVLFYVQENAIKPRQC